MSPSLVFFVLIAYFSLLLGISYFTSRQSDTNTFFTANKQSPWYVVAFGMLGATLSGVTFISVPGAVLYEQFSYFQVVLGYLLGYLVIATVLLPLYYRLNLVSIYTYLQQRFGFWSYKTGSFFFLLSRTIGASFRLFLAATVLQIGLFDSLGIPFWLTTIISVLLIWVYTNKGGINTIVWTDTLQTTFLLLAAIASIYLIKDDLQWTWGELGTAISESKYSKTWFWDSNSPFNFFKQFFAGASITIVMTGLDQDMMQKNLTCRNLQDAQKNMFWFSIVLVFVNIIFLCLGALLYLYADFHDIQLLMQDGKVITDKVYPTLAFKEFGLLAGVAFLLGIIAATYSSADSALTALTTSFCVDLLDIGNWSEEEKRKTVRRTHIGFSILLIVVVIIFYGISKMYPKSNVIGNLFKAAGFTYGPLLGLYTFGLFTRLQVKDRLVPWVCFLAPIISFIIDQNSAAWFGGFKFGFLILLVNGLLTCLGLLLILEQKPKEAI